MTKNRITPNQFFNNWARTNLDPDGIFIDTFISGGVNDTYKNWLKSKEIETKSLDFSTSATTENTQNNENISTTSRKYRWITESNSKCPECFALNNRVFDYRPKITDITHAGCRCQVVEIGEREADLLKIHREAELKRRDLVVERLNEGANFYKDRDGKMHPKKQDQSASQCAGHVADALENGGVNLRKHQNKNDPNYFRAYRYGEYAKKEGFKEIYTHNQNSQTLKPKNLDYKKGDLIVFQPIGKHINGHIAIYSGKQWISDFAQNNPNGIIWGDVKTEDLDFTIYRNSKWQD